MLLDCGESDIWFGTESLKRVLWTVIHRKKMCNFEKKNRMGEVYIQGNGSLGPIKDEKKEVD